MTSNFTNIQYSPTKWQSESAIRNKQPEIPTNVRLLPVLINNKFINTRIKLKSVKQNIKQNTYHTENLFAFFTKTFVHHKNCVHTLKMWCEFNVLRNCCEFNLRKWCEFNLFSDENCPRGVHSSSVLVATLLSGQPK